MTQESNSTRRSAYQRTVIVGNRGFGKSWLAVRLAQAIKGTAIDLDAIHWELGGYGIRRDAAIAKVMVQEAAAGERWVIEDRWLGRPAGYRPVAEETTARAKGKRPDPEDDEAYPPYANDADHWKAHFAEIDALLERTTKVLAGETPLPKSRSHLVYDPDQDEAEAEDLWHDVVKRTSSWPAVAAAAVA